MTLATVSRYEVDQVDARGERAIIIGSSIAGLCAARVLADAYAEVVVLERDPKPDSFSSRRSVPQGEHFHVLTEAARASIEDLFPGYCNDVLDRGGLKIDAGTDWEFFMEGDFLADQPQQYPMYCATRPFYEQILREQVESYPGIRTKYDSRVSGLLFSSDKTRVTGVRVSNDRESSDALMGDLVVDASGKTSQTPAWLESAGIPPPQVERVSIDLRYSSVTLERPPRRRRAVSVIPSSPDTRGGAVLPVENDQWILTLWGMHEQTPPQDFSEWQSFARDLVIPDFANLIDTYRITSNGVTQYPYPANVRRRYEQLKQRPNGLIIVGDALASFNPIYAQGMAVAVLDALVLHQVLRSAKHGNLSDRFFDAVVDVIDVAWMLAVSSDFQYPQTSGNKPRGASVLNWWRKKIVSQAHSDRYVADVLFRVLNMEITPYSLMRPSVVWRVVRPGS